MESHIYENIRNYSATLLSRFRGKYVRVQLIKNQSRNGFVYAIDPEDYSIILVEETETILLPGHAVLGISEIDPQPNLEPPPLPNTCASTDKENLLEKKQRLLSWFRINLIPMTEDGDNLVFGNATIMPPYTVSSIYSPNLSVVTQVRKMMESMPENFEGT